VRYQSSKKEENWKNGANKTIRQGNRDRVDVSNLIHKSWYTLAHAPMRSYHCMWSVEWKMRVNMLLLTWIFS